MISSLLAVTLAFSPANTAEQNSTEIEALQAAVPAATAVSVDLGCGLYHFARQLDVIRPLRFRGAGGGPWSACTVLLFPPGSHGIYFHSHTTYHGSNSQDRAAGSSFEDLRIRADGKTTIRHAFVVKDPVRIERVYVENFSGDGIHLNTGMPLSSASLTKAIDVAVVNGGRINPVLGIERSGGVVTVTTLQPHYYELNTIFWLHKDQDMPFTWHGAFQIGMKGTITDIVNATTFRYSEAGPDAYQTGDSLDVRTGNGVYTHGGDSNSCEFRGIHATGNAGYIVFEDSFLGNSYTKCMGDENKMGAYWGGGYQANAANEFISCYSEQNQPHSYFGSPTIVIGGTHGATVLGRGTFIGAGRMDEVVASVKALDNSRVGSLQIGGSKQSYPAYLTMCHVADPFCSELTLGNPTAQLGGWTGNWLAWKYIGGSQAGFLLSTKGATAPGARAVDVARIAFPTGFYGARGNLETEHYAPPTPGQGRNGDRIWNSGPDVGECLLWVKVLDTWRCAILVP